MTVRAPIIGTNTDTAETFRLAMGGLWVPASALNARSGVTSVPVLTGTGNFTATVSPFTCVVDGTSNSLQGSYPVALDVATTITITAANTQARIDLISMQIQDNAYDSSGFSRGQLVVTAGTPAGSPVAPSTPANAVALWTVPVAANATSVVFSTATAVFPYAAAAGGIVPVRNSADQPAAANGVQYRHRLDVTAIAGGTSPLESSTDGTTWNPVFSAPGAWTAWTPAWTASTNPTLGNGTLVGRYTKTGRVVTATLFLQLGSTTTVGSGFWSFTLPFAPYVSTLYQFASWYAQIGSSVYTGVSHITGLSTNLDIGGAAGSLQPMDPTHPATWTTNNVLALYTTYESTS